MDLVIFEASMALLIHLKVYYLVYSEGLCVKSFGCLTRFMISVIVLYCNFKEISFLLFRWINWKIALRMTFLNRLYIGLFRFLYFCYYLILSYWYIVRAISLVAIAILSFWFIVSMKHTNLFLKILTMNLGWTLFIFDSHKNMLHFWES